MNLCQKLRTIILSSILLTSCTIQQQTLQNSPYYIGQPKISFELYYTVDFNGDGKFDAVVDKFYSTVYARDTSVVVPDQFGILKGAMILTDERKKLFD